MSPVTPDPPRTLPIGRVISYAVVAVGLVLGLVLGATSVPASATAAVRAGGLLGPVGPLPAEAGVSAADGVLAKAGSQQHAFHYRVETDETTWSLELFLVDPRGRQIASSYQNVGGDPMVGRDVFRFWSRGIRPGKYTIKARLTWGDYDQVAEWLEPSTFRLRSS